MNLNFLPEHLRPPQRCQADLQNQQQHLPSLYLLSNNSDVRNDNRTRNDLPNDGLRPSSRLSRRHLHRIRLQFHSAVRLHARLLFLQAKVSTSSCLRDQRDLFAHHDGGDGWNCDSGHRRWNFSAVIALLLHCHTSDNCDGSFASARDQRTSSWFRLLRDNSVHVHASNHLLALQHERC